MGMLQRGRDAPGQSELDQVSTVNMNASSMTNATDSLPSYHLCQRIAFEELLRRRSTTNQERYVEVFRRAAVDPNPHQVEAVAFALRRIPEGGALLCDEVGLGKTIETGLLLTQLRAEGRVHILIVVPVSLSRQWQVELQDLFGLTSYALHKESFSQFEDARGIFIVGREFASSPNWAPRIAERGPWDLVVVDEAHEFLSSIYRRFSRKTGTYLDNLAKGESRRAGWFKTVIGESPVILLTATPLQNSLFELWGLGHFVDPTGTALGAFDQFSTLFTIDDGRSVREGMEEELRTRLSGIVCRTLRSQAQPFLRQPFTSRHCKTISFNLEEAELRLYRAVSDWLAGETAAYRPRHQKLMTLMIRRRMGSSVHALAATLRKVRSRLEENALEEWHEQEGIGLDTLENDIRVLTHLDNLAQQALLGRSEKLAKLGELLGAMERGELEGAVGEKLVVFTESRRTLEAIVAYLGGQGLDGQVTAFSGTNESPEAMSALERWQQEVGRHIDPSQRPSGSAAMRAALVHEFRTRTKVFVATEAGAKGLNLQFCNLLVNFDLPWNPQRIEQRIGRIHRYGQKHDVVIVNFINLDNEGEQRVYEILREKLHLFDGVLGSSDEILGRLSSVLDFENRVLELFASCRTPQDQQREFDRLALELDAEARKTFDERINKARSLIAGLDEDVKARLKSCADTLPAAISRRDQAVLEILQAESPVRRIDDDGDRLIFEWREKRFHLGPPHPSDSCGEPLDLDHPVMRELLARCRGLTDGRCFFFPGTPADHWSVYLVDVHGLEDEQRLLVVGTTNPDGLGEALSKTPYVSPDIDPPRDEHRLSLALADLREEIERDQASRLDLSLRQLGSRKDDFRRVLEYREEKLRSSLVDADERRRRARSPEESRKAFSIHERLKRELDSLMRDRDSQLREASRRIARRQQLLGARRYVEVTPRLLFGLRRGQVL